MDVTIEIFGLKSRGPQVEEALFKKLDVMSVQTEFAKKEEFFRLEKIIIVRHDDATVNFFEKKEERSVLVRITADAAVLENFNVKTLEHAIEEISKAHRFSVYFRYPPLPAVEQKKPSLIRRILKAASIS